MEISTNTCITTDEPNNNLILTLTRQFADKQTFGQSSHGLVSWRVLADLPTANFRNDT